MKQIQMEANLKRNLRALLAANQMTAIELAEKTGLKPRAINHYCTGYATPPIASLGKICRFFDVSLDAMLTKRITIKITVK